MTAPGADSTLAVAVTRLIQGLWSGNDTDQSPAQVFRWLQSHNEFQDFGQHDTQEALRYVINELHERLEVAVPKSITLYVQGEPELASLEWLRIGPCQRPPRQHISIINDTFGGEITNSIRCRQCGNISSTTEHIFELSLGIPTAHHSHRQLLPGRSRPTSVPESCNAPVDQRQSETGLLQSTDKVNSKTDRYSAVDPPEAARARRYVATQYVLPPVR